VEHERLSKQSLNEYIRSLQTRGLSPGGINIHLRTINSFLTWLHEEGHTPERHKVRLDARLDCSLRRSTTARLATALRCGSLPAL
jgi:site-specific recombinase XerD